MIDSAQHHSISARLLRGLTAGMGVLAATAGAAAQEDQLVRTPGRGLTATPHSQDSLRAAPRRMLTTGALGTAVTTVNLDGCTNAGYLATATIGNSNVNIPNVKLTVDTAQGDTLVAANTCTDCGVSPTYNINLSKLGNPNAVSGAWNSGTWSGVTVNDIMNPGTGAQTQFEFAAMTSQSGIYTNAVCTFETTATNTYQGVLGMGPLDLSANAITSGYFWSFDQLPSETMAFAACDNGAYMYLGGTPVSSEQGTVITTPMVESKYYAVEVSGMSVNGKSLGVTAEAIGPVTIASGTGPFLLPSAVYEKVVAAVTAGGGNLPANFFTNGRCVAQPSNFDADALPELTLSFPSGDDGDATSTWTFRGDSSYLYYLHAAEGDDAICPGIASSGATNAVAAWGRTLMRNTILTVDWSNKAVSIAESQGICG